MSEKIEALLDRINEANHDTEQMAESVGDLSSDCERLFAGVSDLLLEAQASLNHAVTHLADAASELEGKL